MPSMFPTPGDAAMMNASAANASANATANAPPSAGVSGTIVLAVFMIALVLGMMIHAALLNAKRKGRIPLYFHDPDTMLWDEKWVKLKDALQVVRMTSGKKGDVPLQGAARLSNGGFIVHARHGWCMRGPTDAELTNGPEGDYMRFLMVTTPEALHEYRARNRVADNLNANKKDDKWAWVPPVAIVAGILLLCIFGAVFWLVIHH